jgi:hypothetical protein
VRNENVEIGMNDGKAKRIKVFYISQLLSDFSVCMNKKQIKN